MTDPRIPTPLANLIDRVKALETAAHRQARASQGGQRTVEDGGSITFLDEAGVPRVVVGATADTPNTFTTQDLNGPALDQPSAPLIASTYEAVTITWDGFDSTGYSGWPADFARVEAHASTVNPYTPDDETQVGAFLSPVGGSLELPLPFGTELFVTFVVVNTSGAESVPSEVRSAMSTNVLDTPTIVRPTVFGGAFSTADPDFPDSGERVVVQNDGDGGVVEFWTGLAGESPGRVDPALLEVVGLGLVRAGIRMVSGTTPARPEPAIFQGYAGEVDGSFASINAGIIFLLAQSNIEFEAVDGQIRLRAADGVRVQLGNLYATMGDGGVGTGTFRDSVDARVWALGESYQVGSTASVSPTGTTFLAIPGMSQTVTSPGATAVYMVDVDLDQGVTTASAISGGALFVDGVQSGGLLVLSGPAGARASTHRLFRVTGLAAGAHTFTVQARSEVAATNTIVRAGTLAVQRVK